MIFKSYRQTELSRIILICILAVFLGYIGGIYAGTNPGIAEFSIIAMSLPGMFVFLIFPEIGFLLLHFSNYLRLSDNLHDFYNAPHFIYPLTILVLVFIIGRWIITKNEPKGWIFPFILILFYGSIIACGFFFAIDIPALQTEFIGFIRGAAIAIITVIMLQTKEQYKRLIWTLIIAGIILGSLSVFQSLTKTYDNNYGGLSQSKVLNIVGQSNDYRIGGPMGGCKPIFTNYGFSCTDQP